MADAAGQVRIRPVRREDLPWLVDRSRAGAEASGEFNDFGPAPDGHLAGQFDDTALLSPQQGTLLVEVDGELVGDVGYRQIRTGGPSSLTYDLGIALLPTARGRGIGAQAQRLLSEHLFAHYPINRVQATTDVDNVAEQKSLERAGFTREGVLRGYQWRRGAWHDLVQYGRLRADP